jgi:hypothetical protein
MKNETPTTCGLSIRWTIGDVSDYGFSALQLSLWGAWQIFGAGANYQVCVNTVPLAAARERTGEVPSSEGWRDVTGDCPVFLQRYFDRCKAEGVGWKFAPLRVSPDSLELALDNDCILWNMPAAIRRWLDTPGSFLFAEDVRPCFGQFNDICGTDPRNSGIRGLPPGFDLKQAFLQLLREHPVSLRSELDEQGLQTAVLQGHDPFIVSAEEVTICSPFPPHAPHVGTCGVHFVGLNAKSLPWEYNGRPGVEYIREHWSAHLPAIREKIKLR